MVKRTENARHVSDARDLQNFQPKLYTPCQTSEKQPKNGEVLILSSLGA